MILFRRSGSGRGALVALALAVAAPVSAHMLNMTRVTVSLPGGGEVAVQVDVDLALLLGSLEAYGALIKAAPAERDRVLTDLAPRVLAETRLRLDGRAPLPLALRDWKLPDVPPERLGDQTVAAMATLRYAGRVPAGARTLTVGTPMLAKVEFPLAYTFQVPAEDLSLTRWLELPGMESAPFNLTPGVWATAPPLATARDAAPGQTPSPSPAAPAATAPAGPAVPADLSPVGIAIARWVTATLQYLRLGFHHIVPGGADHVLFVLGLFFLGLQWRSLVAQTTAFTVAHTTTLGLSAYGIVSLPVRVVEPLIALSIAFVALENIWRPRLSASRVAVVFAFGLVHGLGFASSLSEVPMPRDQFFTALLAFNFGVDFGQLAVIAAAFALVGWFRHRSWYRARIVIPGCVAIAAVGLYWTVQRAFF